MAKKILIIDDEELIIKSFSRLLEKSGYSVFTAKNGQDAIVMFEEDSFDLILADIRMPGINGVETVKRIYEAMSKKGVKQAPAIFITGYADEANEKGAKRLNPVAYMYKPFDVKELFDKIKEATE